MVAYTKAIIDANKAAEGAVIFQKVGTKPHYKDLELLDKQVTYYEDSSGYPLQSKYSYIQPLDKDVHFWLLESCCHSESSVMVAIDSSSDGL